VLRDGTHGALVIRKDKRDRRAGLELTITACPHKGDVSVRTPRTTTFEP
jgi:hypothetical protein